MKVTDYIIEFFIEKGITDIFGYPGGVICHLMDSAAKYDKIASHINYHEQGASFAACGYGQATNKPGVAFATSGPGATNLVTGIANAYFDSTPAIFITGQVDTFAVKGDLNLRQRGFQETDIVSMVKNITKFSTFVEKPEMIRYYMEKAYQLAINGRPGPVLLDIPADVQRASVDISSLKGYISNKKSTNEKIAAEKIINAISTSKRPCLLIGAGIKQSAQTKQFIRLAEVLEIPVVSSLPAFDVLPYEHKHNYGFIGANGHRYANFIIAKSDLVISMGSRLTLKQVGNKRSLFAPSARLIRVDIDEDELQYRVKDSEDHIIANLQYLIEELLQLSDSISFDFSQWNNVCRIIKERLIGIDTEYYHTIIEKISGMVPENYTITVDVGQHELWVAQSFKVKNNQSVFMSAGHGAMGFSLPAAIGIYYGTKKPVISFSGDGGIQMNIQELQFLKREQLPIKVVVINNRSLGMIRHFQEMNFDAKYIHTTETSGYSSPDFRKIAASYDIPFNRIDRLQDIESINFLTGGPAFVEVMIPTETYLHPKFGSQRPPHDQEPLVDRDVFKYLMDL